MEGYRCSCCGKWFDELPCSFAYETPFYWPGLSNEDREASHITPDVCRMRQGDDRFFFVRGVIEIPIIGEVDPFLWGVWCSLSETNFNRFIELYDSPERTQEPPYFSWLSTRINGYPDTLNLKANVTTPILQDRPKIILEATDHPLSVEQRQGITVDRVREIASHFHSKSGPTQTI